jgi:hypothetical protein
MAWQSISPEVTVKGFFNKCCISNAVDGIDNYMLRNSSNNGNVRSECVEDESSDCEYGDSDTDW